MKFVKRITLSPLGHIISENNIEILDVTGTALTLYHTHVGMLKMHESCVIHLRVGSVIDKIDWVHLDKDAHAVIITHSEGCNIPYKHLPDGVCIDHIQDE